MKASEYIAAVTGQMRCKRALGMVEKELADHIADQEAAYLAEGRSREEASFEAVKQMGDAEEVGREMDRVHRPAMDGRMLVAVAVLSLAGGLVQYMMRRIAADHSPQSAVPLPGVAEALTISVGLLLMLAAMKTSVSFYSAGRRPVYIWAMLLACLMVVGYAVVKGWFGGNRRMQLWAVGGASAAVTAGVIFFGKVGAGIAAHRIRAFFQPETESAGAGYMVLKMRDMLSRLVFTGKGEAAELQYCTGRGRACGKGGHRVKGYF